jgi:hypothetical protein
MDNCQDFSDGEIWGEVLLKYFVNPTVIVFHSK